MNEPMTHEQRMKEHRELTDLLVTQLRRDIEAERVEQKHSWIPLLTIIGVGVAWAAGTIALGLLIKSML